MAASAALFMHYVNPVDASLSGAESGCEQVRRSGIGYFFTPVLNLPLLGLVGYGVVLVASVRRPEEAVAPWLAVVAGVGGVVLLALQGLVRDLYNVHKIINCCSIQLFAWLEIYDFRDVPQDVPHNGFEEALGSILYY